MGNAGSSAHHPPPSSGPSEARRTSGSPEFPEELVQKQRSPDSLYTSTPSPGPSYYQRPVSSSQAPPTPAYSVASFVSRTTDESALDVGDHYQSRYHYTPFDRCASHDTRQPAMQLTRVAQHFIPGHTPFIVPRVHRSGLVPPKRLRRQSCLRRSICGVSLPRLRRLQGELRRR